MQASQTTKHINLNALLPSQGGRHVPPGQSSRLYLVGGPEQMMPEEGLSREQRKQLRVMQACCAQSPTQWLSQPFSLHHIFMLMM